MDLTVVRQWGFLFPSAEGCQLRCRVLLTDGDSLIPYHSKKKLQFQKDLNIFVLIQKELYQLKNKMMKKLMLSLALCLFTAFAFAQDKDVYTGQSFGNGVKKGNVITAADVTKKLGKSNKKDMKVTGEVVQVCQKKGCFMTLAMPNGETMFVNFKDYAFFMPKDLAGRKVVIDGFAQKKETSVDDLKHFAADAKKSPEEIAKITAPKKEIVFEAKGVVILD